MASSYSARLLPRPLGLLSLLLAALPASAAPVVTTGTGLSYLEQGAPTVVAPDVAVSGGAPYVGGYLKFDIGSATSTEALSLPTVATADATLGAVSVVGSNLYLGNGTTAEAIGAVDATLNGAAGRALKINFVTAAFNNSSFEDGTTNGWVVSNARVIINGSSTIAGWIVPADPSPTPSNGSQTSPGDAQSATMSYSTTISTNVAAGGVNGVKSLNLTLSGQVGVGGGVVRGPYAVSADSFAVTAGDTVSFWWSAAAAGDAYDVFGYLLNVDNGHTQLLLNATGSSGSATQAWTKVSVAVAETGNYKFVFISGSFDFSFGRALGANLLIDNVQTVAAVSPLNDAVVQAIARLVRYQDTSANPATSRSISITVSNAAAQTASATQSVAVTPVNNAPTMGGLAALGVTPGSPAAPVAAALTLADADDAQFTAASVSITSHRASGDTLSLVTDAGTMGAITASYDGSTGVLTLTGTATVSHYQAALRAVTFATSSSSAAARTLAFSVTDAGATGAGPANASATQQVTITAPAPVITSATTATATFGSTFSYTITATSAVDITSFSATGLPAGLSLDASTGAISGSPSAVGTFTVTIGATNFAGTGTTTLTLSAAKATATVALAGLHHVYSGSAKPVSVSTTPAGLTTAVTYEGQSNAPINAGTYAVAATVTDVNYVGSASDVLVIDRSLQAIQFAAVPALRVGQPVTLSATASSGLPVTFTVVSGPGELTGASLRVDAGGIVVVRASQAGNANFLPASTEQTVSVNKLSQTITFDRPSDRAATEAPFSLAASASSSLPVSFTLLGGPATLSGSTVTLTGAPGTVTLRASQAGNDQYLPAADVERTFAVKAGAKRVFFGAFYRNEALHSAAAKGVRKAALSVAQIGDLAAVLPADSLTGSLLIVAPSAGINAVVPFTLGDNGGFTTPLTQQLDGATRSLTLRGTLAGNTLSGGIDELGLTFTTLLDPATGPSAPIAGLYTSEALASAAGTTYTVVGTNNTVLVLAVTPQATVGGTTALASDGTFSLQAAVATGTATLTGSVHPADFTVSDTLTLPGKTSISFAGHEVTNERNDRLLNLSARARVGAGERVLISGFVVGGSQPKPVLVRAVGPGLQPFGIGAPIAQPQIRIVRNGTTVADNGGWSLGGQAEAIAATGARVGAFTLTPGSADAALLLTLAPGTYTAVVSGGDGVALAEIYDASSATAPAYERLLNISARGQVGANDDVLIGGFVIGGNAPKRVLLRAVGPGLATYGVAGSLADPVLAVFKQAARIAENDDWARDPGAAAAVVSASRATGAFALSDQSTDSALVLSLAAGAYTVQVTGKNGATGVALVEIYEIP